MRIESVQRYARVAGILFFFSLVAGGFGELYVPGKLLVAGDAAATARNIAAAEGLFRLGFAGYLVEAVCDVSLTLIFYVLLRPVDRNLALLSAFFSLVSTATFAFAELFYIAPTLLLGNGDFLRSFSPEQRDALMAFWLRLYGYGGGVFMLFGGIAGVVSGLLIWRSGYIPRVLGAFVALGGVGFITRNFLLVLAPRLASDVLLMPTLLAMLTLSLWLLVRGVDARKWEERVAAQG